MQPGTYIPTHHREIHALAIDRLTTQLDEQSRLLADVETCYRDAGVLWLSVPISLRLNCCDDLVCDDRVRDKLAAAFTVRKGSDGNLEVMPETINVIQVLRDNRDAVKQYLREQDIERAELLSRADNRLPDPQDASAEAVGEYQTLRWNWAMALPENVKAMELGLMRDLEVFGSVFGDEAEDRLYS